MGCPQLWKAYYLKWFCGQMGALCSLVHMSSVTLLSGVLFLKTPLCLTSHSTNPKAGHLCDLCDLGPGWTFLRQLAFAWDFQLLVRGPAEGRTQPPWDFRSSLWLCSQSVPSDFVLECRLVSPKPGVIWGRHLSQDPSVPPLWLVLVHVHIPLLPNYQTLGLLLPLSWLQLRDGCHGCLPAFLYP